jgi:photosystem II stability/assembly factor-like uncharacterized protein
VRWCWLALLSLTLLVAGCTPPLRSIENPPALTRLLPVDGSTLWATSEEQILRSTDGGRQWAAVTPSQTGDPESLVALDADHAWMLAKDSLLSTKNGGRRWTRQSAPFSQAILSFADPENGWALVSGGVAAGSQAVRLYRTDDGGKTWQEIAHAGPGPEGTIPFGGGKTGLYFKDETTGWLTVAQPVAGQISLYRSTDGGKHWTLQEVPVEAPYRSFFLDARAPHFVSDKVGFFAVKVEGDDLGVQSLLYGTEDGGQHWKPVGTSQAWPVWATGPKQAWTLRDGRLLISEDGGATWVEVKQPSGR